MSGDGVLESDDLRRTLFMVNPASGGGRGLRRWQRLQTAEPALASAEVVHGTSAEDASSQLQARVASGEVERVISVGGDGTVHLVANALLRIAEPSPVVLGIVPVGTGSDLARHLGLPTRPLAALRHLLRRATPRPFDVMALRTDDGRRTYCINIASGGLSGAVVTALSGASKRGQLSYLSATLKALLTYQPMGCRVLLDEQEIYHDDLFLVAVANGSYFGKGMHVAPTAQTDDGGLRLVIVPTVPRWTFPWRLPQFLAGRHLGWPGVVYQAGSRIRIEPPTSSLPYELDGELFTSSPVQIEVRPGALRMLI